MNILETLGKLAAESGFAGFLAAGGWKNLIMIAIACVLLYLGIVKKFEPLLLVGIAFGCQLTNLPGAGLYHLDMWDAYVAGTPYVTAAGEVIDHITFTTVLHEGGLLDVFYIGVKAGVYPSIIFMGVGAMTDFGPLLANPKSMLLGAAAQMGVFADLGTGAYGSPRIHHRAAVDIGADIDIGGHKNHSRGQVAAVSRHRMGNGTHAGAFEIVFEVYLVEPFQLAAANDSHLFNREVEYYSLFDPLVHLPEALFGVHGFGCPQLSAVDGGNDIAYGRLNYGVGQKLALLPRPFDYFFLLFVHKSTQLVIQR